jgi:hypothetical protein
MSKKEDENLVRNVFNEVKNHQLETGKNTTTTVVIRNEQKRVKLPDNIMVFQTFAFLASRKLLPCSNKILMWFFSGAGYENFIGVDVLTLVEDLNMSKKTIIVGLKELEDNNIIIKFKNTRDGRRNDYLINPTAAWRGNSVARNSMLKKVNFEDPKQLKMWKEE